MKIYDGDIQDISNFGSHSFLQINSCGIQTCSTDNDITYREKGRLDYHIVYMLSGRCKIKYEGKFYDIEKGFVLYPPNSRQRYVGYKNTKRIWLHFTGDCIEEILAEAGLKGGVYETNEHPFVEKILLDLVSEHNKKINISSEKALLMSALYALGKLVNNELSDNKIDKAVSYITANYNTNIKIKDLAASYALSESRFMHLFKEKTGLSPRAYQQKLRINNAKSLLKTTTLNISEIAYVCGYEDPLYFSRIFKKCTNISPKEYRK